MKRIKVLFVITKSNFGGAQRYVYELATHLSPERFEAVAAFGGSGLLKTYLDRAHIRTCSIHNFERDISLRKEFCAAFELAQIIRRERPDVIHLNSSKAGGTGAFVARIMGVPRIIFTAHGWPYFEKRNFAVRSLIWLLSYITVLLAHQTIVVSHHDEHRVSMPGCRNKITFIPTGVPAIKYLPREEARTFLAQHIQRAIPASAILVGSIGEYVRNKNLLTAIQAFERVQKNSTEDLLYVLIGGDGDERPALERYLREHDLSDHVVLAGFIDSARTYLKAFDIFFMPSYKEGLPYGLLEAGGAALPVIASTVGGIPEVITNEVSGVLRHPDDIPGFASALAHLVSSPSTREAYGQKLASHITYAYALNHMIDATTALYTSR